jgi:proline iminopeptidase
MLAQQYAIQAEHALTFIVAGGTAASYEYGMVKECIYHHAHPLFARIKEIMDLLSKPETPVEERQALSYEWTLASFVEESNLQRLLKMPNSGKTVGTRLTYFREIEYPTMDFRPYLPSITVPCWIYAGRFDTQCPVQFGEEIARLIPHAHLTIFERSNHFPFVEEEEQFAQALTNFLGQLK